jgi:hypothetical protein
MNQLQDGESVARASLVRFIKGTTAGLIAASLLQPLQVVKTTMQITPIEKKETPKIKIEVPIEDATEMKPERRFKWVKKYPVKAGNRWKNLSFREATVHIYKQEGLKGFMRGIVPSLIKNSLMTG